MAFALLGEEEEAYEELQNEVPNLIVEELEKIKEEIIKKYWDCDICKFNGHFNIRGDINDILQIIDNRIAELKGENK